MRKTVDAAGWFDLHQLERRSRVLHRAAMYRHFAAALVLTTTVMVTISARAQEIPKLGVEQLCHATSTQSISPLAATGNVKGAFDQCMQAERSYLDQLKKEWPTFVRADKQHCLSLAKTGGGSASYAELITCLEMARDARQLKGSSAQPSRKQ